MSKKNKDLEKTGSDISTEKTNNKKSRRNILKKLAVGGIAGAALPTQWSRPVVDSVMLPAHAQTSDDTVFGGGGAGLPGPGPAPADSIGEEILDFFTPRAEAGATTYCIEISIARDNKVITGVTVTKLCYEACTVETTKDGKYEMITPTALSGSGTNWSGQVNGRELILSEVNPEAEIVAKSNYASMPGGEIKKNASCDCCTIPG